MGIEKGTRFLNEAVFVDYPFESVMFRWDHTTKQVFRKFYGERESLQPIPHDNRLYNEALMYGNEITAIQYAAGKPKK
jgi:hypothetical protein